MKKLLVILMLATLSVAGIAAGPTKSGAIREGYASLSRPILFTAADSIAGRGGSFIVASDSLVITITNLQKYLQHQTITTSLVKHSGNPSVVITLRGRVTATDNWHPIGTPITWTTSGDNPATITSTVPLAYNYLKISYVASGAAQCTQVTAFDVRTANVYDIGKVTAMVLGDGTGTIAVNSSDWDISATGAMTGIGAVTMNGLLTGSLGATLTGAAINLNASSNFATNIGTGTTNAAVTIGGGSNTVAVNSSDWDISTTGDLTGIGAITSDGAVNFQTGGHSYSNASPIVWAKGGATVLATSGTDVACSNGARWWVEVEIPHSITVTGLAYLVGSVGGTDSVMVHLYNSAGTLVATSRHTGATHGAIVGTAAQFQSVAFTTPYVAVSGRYYAAVQFNGTTAKFRAYPIPGSKFIASTAAGTWDTNANITPGTTFTADKGPILMLY
jgi:hypothetical protein